LASSQSELEREKIRDKMNEYPALARILRQLDTGKGDEDISNGDEETSSRTSRRKEVENGENGDVSGGQVGGSRAVIDLEDIAFAQGSHFMSNKRCQLPDGSFRKQRKGIE